MNVQMLYNNVISYNYNSEKKVLVYSCNYSYLTYANLHIVKLHSNQNPIMLKSLCIL